MPKETSKTYVPPRVLFRGGETCVGRCVSEQDKAVRKKDRLDESIEGGVSLRTGPAASGRSTPAVRPNPPHRPRSTASERR